jgi:hypothetical protein
MTFYTNSSERMRIDSSGNVIVGGTSAVYGAANRGVITINGASSSLLGLTTGGADKGFLFHDGTNMLLSNTVNAALLFQTNNTERMRIDSSGNLLVGTTNSFGGSKAVIYNTGSGDTVFSYTSSSSNASASYSVYRASTSGYSMYYNINGNEAGKITHPTQTTTNYATSSDYRLKENIAPLQNALQTIALLKPVSFTWKSDKINDIGFIAHELQEVCPLAVSGKKDELKPDGTPIYQSVDTARLVATLTAAIQEQQAIITDLKARIETLESK